MTNIVPKKYTKQKFIEYLKENNVNSNIIDRLNELPEVIERNGDYFKLSIEVIWYNSDNTHYEFELNYYSDDLIEYLFSPKVFKNIEMSINNLICELVNAKNLKKVW